MLTAVSTAQGDTCGKIDNWKANDVLLLYYLVCEQIFGNLAGLN